MVTSARFESNLGWRFPSDLRAIWGGCSLFVPRLSIPQNPRFSLILVCKILWFSDLGTRFWTDSRQILSVIVKFRCSKPWFQVPIANCPPLPVELKLSSSMRFFHRFHWFENTFGQRTQFFESWNFPFPQWYRRFGSNCGQNETSKCVSRISSSIFSRFPPPQNSTFWILRSSKMNCLSSPPKKSLPRVGPSNSSKYRLRVQWMYSKAVTGVSWLRT